MVFIISGKQGSGKTTLSGALVTKLNDKGYSTHQVKIAEALYKMHDAVLDVLAQYGIRRSIVKDGPLLQLLGEEWGRKTLNENIWVDLAAKKVATIISNSKRDSVYFINPAAVIIDDARFENEIDAFPDAYKIRLECDRDIRKARCSMWRDNEDHPSETSLDCYATRGRNEFDCYINTEVAESKDFVDTIIDDALRIRNESNVSKILRNS